MMGNRPAEFPPIGELSGVCKISRSEVARVCAVLRPDELPTLCVWRGRLPARLRGDKDAVVALGEKDREYSDRNGFEIAPAAIADEIKGFDCVWDISVIGVVDLGSRARNVEGGDP